MPVRSKAAGGKKPQQQKAGKKSRAPPPQKRNAKPVEDEDDDDEELDEDMAFNAEDEAKYGKLMHSSSGAKGKSQAKQTQGKGKGRQPVSDDDDDEDDMDNDDDDEEDEDDDEDGEGTFRLSDLLDGSAALPSDDEEEEEPKPKAKQAKPAAKAAQKPKAAAVESDEEEDNEDGSDSDDSDEDADSALGESDEDAVGNEADHEKLLNMLGVKLTKKIPRSKAMVHEEAADEAEFNLAPQNAESLTLTDLMESLQHRTDLGQLKKKLSHLESKQPLAPPVDDVHRERATRQIAYKQATDTVSQWQGVVAANRVAPTINLVETQDSRITTNALKQKFQPTTDLEREVERLLAQSGLASERTVRVEESRELAVNELTAEEVKKRREELSKMRALLFYEEQRRRRANKIKSKTYRKLLKKQREKEDQRDRELLKETNPELYAQLEASEAADAARERMTLRHRNNSKWVKWALRHGGTQEEHQRDAINEQLQLGQKLTRKIHQMDGHSSSGSDDEGNGVNKLVQEAKQMAEGDDEEPTPTKGLFALKFMQQAVDKQKAAAREHAKKLVSELSALTGDAEATSDDAASDDDDTEDAAGASGRRKFAGGTAASRAKAAATKPTEEQKEAAKGVHALLQGAGNVQQMPSVRSSAGHVVAMQSAIDVSNPWMAPTQVARRSGDHTGAAAGTAATVPDTVLTALQKVTAPAAVSKQVEISVELPVGGGKRPRTAAPAAAQANSNSDDAEEKSAQPSGKPPKASGKRGQHGADEQAELVRRAFAIGGDMEEQFAHEKAELEDEDKPQESKALQGWGSWAGLSAEEIEAAEKAKKKKKAKPAPLPAPTTQKPKPRADRGMSHVIINEKRDKKFSKFQVGSVPYPFTSREQYERAIRAPLGKDWNTSTAVDTMTKPEVISRMGTIIAPIAKSAQVKRKSAGPGGVSNKVARKA